ncbi:Uncharacterized protein dnm_026370 [Desulfonema magnum]|uniref:Uncharacterized protein n=1 Tax=Desulfonema magnum TaxID=45655 RepID=A0A975BK71_9BACT|nr:Uncharacterized protein dnm_026370 [Desulfonema magnum]
MEKNSPCSWDVEVPELHFYVKIRGRKLWDREKIMIVGRNR